MAGFWESCLLRFEQELPAQQFNTWIKPLRLEGESAPQDGLRLIAPNSFILKWVRDRYSGRIEEYAQAFFKTAYQHCLGNRRQQGRCQQQGRIFPGDKQDKYTSNSGST